MGQMTAVDSPTIRVRVVVWGGLGNQMFCAAAGMALADRLGGSLELGIHQYTRDSLRKYELGSFKLPKSKVSNSRWHLSARSAMLLRLKNRLFAHSQHPTTIWRQTEIHYDETFGQLSGNIYLRGGFQSYRYFDTSAEVVRNAYNLNPLLSEVGRIYVDQTIGEDSVAVHIRRGDYTDPANSSVFPVLSREYYLRALSLICRVVPRPRIFVVSDEPEAARVLLADYPDATIIQGTTHFDDMHIISVCRHRILANSSFSWWGAWLDARSDGVTIAPREYFTRDHAMKHYMSDFYPAGWITI